MSRVVCQQGFLISTRSRASVSLKSRARCRQTEDRAGHEAIAQLWVQLSAAENDRLPTFSSSSPRDFDGTCWMPSSSSVEDLNLAAQFQSARPQQHPQSSPCSFARKCLYDCCTASLKAQVRTVQAADRHGSGELSSRAFWSVSHLTLQLPHSDRTLARLQKFHSGKPAPILPPPPEGACPGTAQCLC